MKRLIGLFMVCTLFSMGINAQSLLKSFKNTADSVRKTKEAAEKFGSSISGKKKKSETEGKQAAGEIQLDSESAFYIYLNLSDTKITDDMYLDYAKTVEHNVYEKYKNDEFEWHDKFEEIKSNFNKKIENANVDGKYVLMTNVEIGDYDFTNGGYPFKIDSAMVFTKKSIYNTFFYDYPETDLFRNEIAIKLTDLDKYNFFKMNKDEAKSFLQGRKNSYGNINRVVAVICHYEIESFNTQEYKNFETLCGKKYIPLLGTLSSVEIYDNAGNNFVKLADAEKKQIACY